MELVNAIQKEKSINKEVYITFLKLLSPFAPHLAEELWANLGNKNSISEEKFFALVHAGFASKRKQLKGNLKKYFGSDAAPVLEACGIPTAARAEDVALLQWKRLAST